VLIGLRSGDVVVATMPDGSGSSRDDQEASFKVLTTGHCGGVSKAVYGLAAHPLLPRYATVNKTEQKV
jgi:hypothetical protein